MKFHKSGILIFLILILWKSACITTNYYTARTLNKGETVMVSGLDNLFLILDEGGIVEKHLYFTPSVGFATGLPWRLETGMRFYLPYTLEANLRHQLNPRSFQWFDISFNFHSGIYFADEYKKISSANFKFGFTISKEIFRWQPYISYYLYKNYQPENNPDYSSDYTIVCFGIAIPFEDNLIFPEWNYLKNEHGDFGYYTFGLGFRVPLKKTK